MANEIRKFYFGNKILNASLQYDYFKFTSDLNWVYVVDQSVRNVSKILKGKAYYAFFAVDSILNVWKKLKPPFPAELANATGAAHGDDVKFELAFYFIFYSIFHFIKFKLSVLALLSIQVISNQLF